MASRDLPPPPDPVFIFRGSDGPVTSIMCQSSRSYVISGSQAGVIQVWDPKIRRPIDKLFAHEGSVLSICEIKRHDDKGTRIVTHGREGKIYVWQQEESGVGLSKVATYKGSSLGFCAALHTQIDTATVLVIPTSNSSEVELVDMATKSQLCTLRPDASEKAFGMCMQIRLAENTATADAHHLLVAYEDGSLASWDLKTYKLIDRQTFHAESVMCFDFHSGKHVGISGSTDTVLCSWTLDRGKLCSHKTVEITNPGVNCVKIRSDGKLFVTGGWDGNIRVFTMRMKPLAVLVYHKDSIQCAMFAADNTLFVGGKDSIISVWDIYK